PLRERREDIPPLVMHGIKTFAEQIAPERAVPTITDQVMLRLTGFDWPGNVRQLLNSVQNMVVTAIGPAEPDEQVELGLDHLPAEIREAEVSEAEPTGGGSLAGTSLDQLEKRAIRETLRLTGGNREQAASLLGIGERTLYRKLKEYGLR
ncbi:MAG: helix-turn-helix domain-containing protein, partial [Planctomycetota bacterium]